MSRRRRAALLLVLSVVLGGLAASDVSRREAALEAQLGPATPVVVARSDLTAGSRVTAGRLAVRRMPSRFAPPDAVADPRALIGQELAVPVARGAPITVAALSVPDTTPAGPSVRRGERIAEVVASAPSELVVPGARVDVLVTRERRDDEPGGTRLALQDVEVVSAEPVEGAEADGRGGERVAAGLRVRLAQAVYLAAAQAFSAEIRLLPRAAGDRVRAARLEVGDGL